MEVNQLIGEDPIKQKEVLEIILSRIISNHLKLDFNYRFELAELILLLQENAAQKLEKMADSQIKSIQD